MFQPRHLFQRSGSAAKQPSESQVKVSEEARQTDRHPAMRGLKVSPVHGRYCICGRCEQHSDAA